MYIRFKIYGTIPKIIKVSINPENNKLSLYNRIVLAKQYKNWFNDEMGIDIINHTYDGNDIKFKILEEKITNEVMVAFKLRFA